MQRTTNIDGTSTAPRWRTRAGRALAATAVAALGLVATGPAGASHEPGPTLACDDEVIVAWPNSGEWGVKKPKAGSTTYIPVSRTVVVQVLGTDVTYGPFSYEKGNGNAHQQQDTVQCTFTVVELGTTDPFTGHIVDAEFTITLTAVRRP